MGDITTYRHGSSSGGLAKNARRRDVEGRKAMRGASSAASSGPENE
jgi:hypothetical protein